MTWVDNNYYYKKRIVIDHTKVLEDCTNFPVLISVTDANFKTVANGGHSESDNGYDFVFYDADEATKLDHELISYTKTTGKLIAWVRKPVLDHDADDYIWIYYGKPVVANPSKNTTWDSSYKIVHHMGEASGNIIDSSQSANNGTANGGLTYAVGGKINSAGGITFNGTTGYFALASLLAGTKGTISAWIKVSDTAQAEGVILANGVLANNTYYEMYSIRANGGHLYAGTYCKSGASANITYGSTALEDGVWHYVCILSDAATWTMYIDNNAAETVNVQSGSNTGEWFGDYGSFTASAIGVLNRLTKYGFFKGSMEEVRHCQGVTKTANWIKTEYNNQSSPGTFISFDAEQSQIPAWGDANYGYRKRMVIDHNKVPVDCTNFPVLISVSDPSLADTGHSGHVQSSSGYDIKFYDADNSTVLDHEIESYTNTNGTLVYWVRKPVLDHDADDTIWLYYGKAGVIANPSVRTTWNTNYKLVLHMDESGQLLDSSQYTHNSSGNLADQDNSGQINKCQKYTKANVDYSTFTDDDDFSFGTGLADVSFTLSFWLKPTAAATLDYMFIGKDIVNNREYYAFYRTTGTPLIQILLYDNSASKYIYTNFTVTLSTTAFSHVVLTYDGSGDPTKIYCYVNGQNIAGSAHDDAGYIAMENTTTNLGIGTQIYNTNYTWDGKIDEVRIQKSNAQSLNWSLTEYNNQGSPATFEGISVEMVNSGSALTKSLSDTMSFSDILARTVVFERALADNMTLSEALTKVIAYNRTLTDNITFTDSIAKTFGFYLSDNEILSDILTKQFVLNRTLNDTMILSDVNTFDFGKILSDTMDLSESLIKVFSYNRSLQETMTLTDSSIFDFGKNLSETLIISDVISFGMEKILIDTEILSDLIKFDYGKSLSDNLILSDLLKFYYEKILSDDLVLSDIIATLKGLGLNLSDTLVLSDLLSLGFEKVLTDTMTFSETFLRTVGYNRSLFDILTITGDISKTIGRNLVDTMGLSDSISIIRGMFKDLFDTMLFSDSLLATITIKNTITLLYNGGFIELHKPYWAGAISDLELNVSNLTFRSGDYTSYVNEIDDERITLIGFENDSAMTKFNTLSTLADSGLEIQIFNLKSQWDATYILESINYKPIGLDVFEYRMTFRWVKP